MLAKTISKTMSTITIVAIPNPGPMYIKVVPGNNIKNIIYGSFNFEWDLFFYNTMFLIYILVFKRS